jgi:hypothetical protein
MMNAANRLLVVLGSLVFIVLVVAVIVLAWAAAAQSIDRMGDLVQYMDAHDNTTSKLVITFGGAILILVALIVILLELVPPAPATVAVGGVEAGRAVLSTDAIARRLEELLTDVADVAGARAKVVGKGKAVDVNLVLHVDPGANVATVADEACRVVQDALAQQMRVAVSRPPRVRLHYERLPSAAKKGPRTPPQPVPAEAREPTVKLPRQQKASPADQATPEEAAPGEKPPAEKS